MKNFKADFFDVKNFLIKKEIYSYLDDVDFKKAYHICYNVNNGFIPILGAAIVSVLENNKKTPIVFHILTDGYSQENANRIKELAKNWQCSCILYQLNMAPFQDFHIKVERFSRITYGRIYMPKILKGITSRYMYFDADTMCIAPLDKLWNIDMKGFAMGAVSERANDIAYRAGYLHLRSGKYFNDGVMIIDIDEWEKRHITEEAFSYQCEPRKRFLGQDQDIMNLVFDGDILFLSSKYNVYGGGEDDKGDGVIIHWTGRRKPWQMVVSSFDEQWRRYNALSPWKTITNITPVKKPANYHDFKYWGKYRKEKGCMKDYLTGMFWYSLLKIGYKLGAR